ncbi:MAG: CoA transferase [Chloroflexota bacterium]
MGLPLKDVRVLDLSVFVSGPFGTMILGDLGAEVIKIEMPGSGVPGRHVPPYFVDGESSYFISMNRNKKSLTLNLKTDQGREIFYELVKHSDVVLDNFRPGVTDRLGITYDTLKEINPRIIVCSITGFGSTGPAKDMPAFDLIIQARGGIMSYTGEPDRKPVKMGSPIGDLAGALYAVNGILAALYQRKETGRGQRVDISMLDCQLALHIYRAQNYFVGGAIPTPLGTGHTSINPLGTFPTKTFDVVIDCNTQKIFNDMCAAMGHPEMGTDPRFNTLEHRLNNKEVLNAWVREMFLKYTGEELLELLQNRIPIAPINTIDKAFEEPQPLSRNMVVKIDYASRKDLRIVGNPIKLSEVDKEVFKIPPRLSEDTAQILADLLHYSPEKIAQLRQEEII